MSPRWRTVMVAASAAVLAAGSMAVGTVTAPAQSSACPPGETGVTNGCSPFCVPGRQLDVETGLCLPTPRPPAPNGGATAAF